MHPRTETLIFTRRDAQFERREVHVDFPAGFINAMETAAHDGIVAGHMVAVVGELFAGGEPRRFTDDLVAFDYQMRAIAMRDDPLASEQGDDPVGTVVDGDEIDEGMRLVRRQAAAAMMIAEFVEPGGQAG